VVGFKPTAGLLSTRGALRFSPTLDQVGAFARTSAVAASVAAVMAGRPPADWVDGAPLKAPTLAAIDTDEWRQAEEVARQHYWDVTSAIERAGASVTRVSLPAELDNALAVHRTIVAAEAHRFIEPLVASMRHLCSPQLVALLDEGRGIPEANYVAAIGRRSEMVRVFDQWVDDFDAILTMPTLGEAPSLETTGDPRFCTRWTLVGAPAMTVPSGLGPNHLPLGIQIVGGRNRDRQVVSVARWVEQALPRLGPPPIPDAAVPVAT
jgi:Asp-tRNA(Asn)/Glu-tRNA(Gln) amidotransferase A subunit family amidase